MATGQFGRYAPPLWRLPFAQIPYIQVFATSAPDGCTPISDCPRFSVEVLAPLHSKLGTKTWGRPLCRTSATATGYMSFASRSYWVGSTPSRAKSAFGSLTSTGHPRTARPFGRHAYTNPSNADRRMSRRLPPSSGASTGASRLPRSGSLVWGLSPCGVGTGSVQKRFWVCSGNPLRRLPREFQAYTLPLSELATISSRPSPRRSPTAVPAIGSRTLRRVRLR